MGREINIEGLYDSGSELDFQTLIESIARVSIRACLKGVNPQWRDKHKKKYYTTFYADLQQHLHNLVGSTKVLLKQVKNDIVVDIKQQKEDSMMNNKFKSIKRIGESNE